MADPPGSPAAATVVDALRAEVDRHHARQVERAAHAIAAMADPSRTGAAPFEAAGLAGLDEEGLRRNLYLALQHPEPATRQRVAIAIEQAALPSSRPARPAAPPALRLAAIASLGAAYGAAAHSSLEQLLQQAARSVERLEPSTASSGLTDAPALHRAIIRGFVAPDMSRPSLEVVMAALRQEPGRSAGSAAAAAIGRDLDDATTTSILAALPSSAVEELFRFETFDRLPQERRHQLVRCAQDRLPSSAKVRIASQRSLATAVGAGDPDASRVVQRVSSVLDTWCSWRGSAGSREGADAQRGTAADGAVRGVGGRREAMRAIDALGRTSDPLGVRTLLGFLDDEVLHLRTEPTADPTLVVATITALGSRRRSPQAAEAIARRLSALPQELEGIRTATGIPLSPLLLDDLDQAMGQLTSSASWTWLRGRIATRPAASARLLRSFARPLEPDLLGSHEVALLRGHLHELFASDRALDRCIALEALAEIGHPDDRDAIWRQSDLLLRATTDATITSSPTGSAGSAGSRPTAAPLVRHDVERAQVARSCYTALGKLADPDYFHRLVHYALAIDPPDLRRASIDGLASVLKDDDHRAPEWVQARLALASAPDLDPAGAADHIGDAGIIVRSIRTPTVRTPEALLAEAETARAPSLDRSQQGRQRPSYGRPQL